MDFAERLSLWLGPLDAIGLQAALQAIRNLPAQAPACAAAPTEVPLREELERTRGVLARAIAEPVLRELGLKDGFAPYAERHLELQRRMELAIAPLRAHARELLGRQSPRLRRLALLDATLEQALAGRAQGLLAGLPALLKARYTQLRAAAAAAPDGAPAGAQHGAQDEEWLQAFDRDWRQALRAELEVRLAPVVGLVEAAAGEKDGLR